MSASAEQGNLNLTPERLAIQMLLPLCNPTILLAFMLVSYQWMFPLTVITMSIYCGQDRGKLIFDGMSDKLTPETVAGNLCGYRNRMVGRTEYT